MKTIMIIPITQTVYDFWDQTIPLTESDSVSEVGFKVREDCIEVQVKEDEVEKAKDALTLGFELQPTNVTPLIYINERVKC